MMTMTEPLSDRALAEIEHNLSRASLMAEDAARSYYQIDVSRLLAEVRRLQDAEQQRHAKDAKVERLRKQVDAERFARSDAEHRLAATLAQLRTQLGAMLATVEGME
jgi:hypothetical protein